MRAALLVLALWGCDYPEADFAADLADATCDLGVRCFGETPVGTGPYAQCEGEGREPDDSLDCAYNPTMASLCVSGVGEMECPATDEPPLWPGECALVYSCAAK